MQEIIINGEGCIAGRVASFVAKKALQGNKIIIVNCNKIVILGKKKNILENYQKKFSRGRDPQKGPHFHRVSDKIMRRIVRGMLPWTKTKGREAFRKVHCFKDIPEKYKGKEMVVVAKADAINFLSLGKLCKLIGKER